MTYQHIGPRAKRLDDAGRRRLEELLAKDRLSGYERGALRALGREAGGHDQERVRERLSRSRRRSSGEPTMVWSVQLVGVQLGVRRGHYLSASRRREQARQRAGRRRAG